MRFVRGLGFAWLLCMLIAPSRAHALEKGLRAGVDFATLSGDFGKLAGVKHKAGFTAGGFAAVSANPNVALQVEALYTLKGGKLDGVSVDQNGNIVGSYTTFMDLHYIDVPVLLRLTGGERWPVRPMLVAGPDLGFGLAARYHDEPGGLSGSLGNLHAVDLGWTAGGGLRWAMSGTTALAELRYTRGFGDLWDIRGNIESINSVFSLTMGIGW